MRLGWIFGHGLDYRFLVTTRDPTLVSSRTTLIKPSSARGGCRTLALDNRVVEEVSAFSWPD